MENYQKAVKKRMLHKSQQDIFLEENGYTFDFMLMRKLYIKRK